MSDLFSTAPVDGRIERAVGFTDDHHGSYDRRIRASVAPQADSAVTWPVWERLATLAHERSDLVVHTHVLETSQSNTMVRSNGAKDSLALLEDLDVLGAGSAPISSSVRSNSHRRNS